MGMGFAPTWLRQVSPPASHDYFNHCGRVPHLYRRGHPHSYIRQRDVFRVNCQGPVDAYRKMLKQPCPHDVRGDFGKDPSLLLLARQTRLRIVVHQTVARADAVVQAVACVRSTHNNNGTDTYICTNIMKLSVCMYVCL